MWIAAALFLVPSHPPDGIVVTEETYHHWPNAYRISNGLIDCVVVPKIGRIMRFGYVGQPNLLWENHRMDGSTVTKPGEFVNYGGDRVLPAPKSLWTGFPDTKIDGSVWSLERIPNGVRITSPVGGKIKVSFVRDITLHPAAPYLYQHNRMSNHGPRKRLAVWQIAQTANPDWVSSRVDPAPNNLAGWHGYDNSSMTPGVVEWDSGRLILIRSKAVDRRFGIFSFSGELLAKVGEHQWHSTSTVRRGLHYVDRNSPLQVFLSADPFTYVSLQHTSPWEDMDTGESVNLDVTWRLE